ncbi:MAG: metal ABC transporter permease [Rhodospirillales bacterium]|nr:metal ABC transporter permease [Rhodospirillales bacterium]
MLDDFFTRALIAGIGLALVTGPAGCFVVWRRLAYFGETIAHSSLLGVAFAIVISIDLVIGILASAALVAFIMFYLDRRGTLPTDTLLGLLAHGGLALGLVILSFFPTMRIDLHGLLFGDILAVARVDLAVIWGGGAVVLGVLAWLWRPLLAATVNPDLAAVADLKPDRARLIFGLLVAAIIAAAIKIVGILLIVALLIIPAATARRFAPSPEWMAAGAAAVGAGATVGGLYASATRDTPSGPSIVVTALAFFIVTRADGLRKAGQLVLSRGR